MRPAVAELLLGSRPCYTTIPDSTFVRTAETFNERIATIEEKLGELSTSRAFLAVSDGDIRGTWERITSFEWRRNLLRSAVERIDVQRVGKGCHTFDSAAITITWRA
jgi:hypothetical protein